jgi:hypothetical protein
MNPPQILLPGLSPFCFTRGIAQQGSIPYMVKSNHVRPGVCTGYGDSWHGQIWPCLMNARPAERELFPQGPRTFTTQLGMAAAVLHSYIKSRRTHSSSPCSSSFKASLEPTVLAWNFSRDKELSLLPCHLRDKCTSFLSPLSLFTSYFRLFSVFFFCFCALEITVIRSWTRQRPCKSIVPAAANASSEAVKQCVSSMRPENILLRRLLSKAEGKL